MEIFRQILTVEIKKPKSKPFLVTAWYRPPDSKVEIFDKFESADEEAKLVESAVPKSTRYENKWAYGIFQQ